VLKLIRLLSKLALHDKMNIFSGTWLTNFEGICIHMADKFIDQDAKKEDFSYKWSFERSLFSQSKKSCCFDF
jgi:hypothetical protein